MWIKLGNRWFNLANVAFVEFVTEGEPAKTIGYINFNGNNVATPLNENQAAKLDTALRAMRTANKLDVTDA